MPDLASLTRRLLAYFDRARHDWRLLAAILVPIVVLAVIAEGIFGRRQRPATSTPTSQPRVIIPDSLIPETGEQEPLTLENFPADAQFDEVASPDGAGETWVVYRSLEDNLQIALPDIPTRTTTPVYFGESPTPIDTVTLTSSNASQIFSVTYQYLDDLPTTSSLTIGTLARQLQVGTYPASEYESVDEELGLVIQSRVITLPDRLVTLSVISPVESTSDYFSFFADSFGTSQ